MNKTRIALVSLLTLLIMPLKVWAWAQIYDSDNELLYVGGYDYFKTVRDYDRTKQDEYSYLKKSIYEINIEKNTKREIFKTQKSIYGFKRSEKGYLAISACKSNKCDLIILNRDGEKIKEIKEVPATLYKKFFQWSPDGLKIAYMKGGNPSGEPTLAYSKVWIYDVEDDETIEVSKTVYDMFWAEHDGNIYMRVNPLETDLIYMFNPNARKEQYTKRKGMRFSSDGQYYLGTKALQGVDAMEEDYFIYKTNDNSVHYAFNKQKVVDNVLLKVWMGYGAFIKNSRYYLTWNGRFKILDIPSKQIIRKENNSWLIGWNQDMTKAVVYDGGNQVHIDELQTGKRLQSIDLPKK